METALAVKNVDFYGDGLLAAQDKDGKVWAGVSYICNGIGFTKHQKDRQIANIQSDLVLKQGASNLRLPTNSGVQSALCLYIDFVPLWLAKISITPKMQRDNPKLVEKLINYQLKAKDVLAKAFLPQYQKSNNIPNEYKDYIDQRVQQCVTSYIEPLHKDLQLGLNSIHNAFIGVQKALPAINQVLPPNVTKLDSNSVEETTDETVLWKRKIYTQANNIIKNSPTLTKSPQVLHSVYTIMRNQYGIVFEQEKKDYKENTALKTIFRRLMLLQIMKS
jgi:P22_AR N-terminal domain.